MDGLPLGLVLRWLEEGGASHGRLEGAERRADDAEHEGVIGFLRKVGVAADVLNLGAADDAIRVGREAYGRKRADGGGGDACPLEFLCYRCAATMAGPSACHL